MGTLADKKPFNVILGKKISALRERKGWSQLELADELGYESTGIISLIESGQTGMKREKVFAAATVLGVPAWVLFDDQDYSEEELSMFADFRNLLKKKDPRYLESVKALLRQASSE